MYVNVLDCTRLQAYKQLVAAEGSLMERRHAADEREAHLSQVEEETAVARVDATQMTEQACIHARMHARSTAPLPYAKYSAWRLAVWPLLTKCGSHPLAVPSRSTKYEAALAAFLCGPLSRNAQHCSLRVQTPSGRALHYSTRGSSVDDVCG